MAYVRLWVPVDTVSRSRSRTPLVRTESGDEDESLAVVCFADETRGREGAAVVHVMEEVEGFGFGESVG